MCDDFASLLCNLDIVLSHEESANKFILFCSGFYKDIDFSIKNKGKHFVMGKLSAYMKSEIICYLNYLITNIKENQISIKFQDEIIIIHNITIILNNNKEQLIAFLCGFLDREDWISYEQFGNEYIMGVLFAIKEPKIFTFCEYLLSSTGVGAGNMAQDHNMIQEN